MKEVYKEGSEIPLWENHPFSILIDWALAPAEEKQAPEANASHFRGTNHTESQNRYLLLPSDVVSPISELSLFCEAENMKVLTMAHNLAREIHGPFLELA
jgi:hypothetical protein